MRHYFTEKNLEHRTSNNIYNKITFFYQLKTKMKKIDGFGKKIFQNKFSYTKRSKFSRKILKILSELEFCFLKNTTSDYNGYIKKMII